MEIKAKYFLLEPKCGVLRQNGGRLGDLTEAGRPVLQGLEVILQIWRLRGHFCGDHGASAPPPSSRSAVVSWPITSPFSPRDMSLFSKVVTGKHPPGTTFGFPDRILLLPIIIFPAIFLHMSWFLAEKKHVSPLCRAFTLPSVSWLLSPDSFVTSPGIALTSIGTCPGASHLVAHFRSFHIHTYFSDQPCPMQGLLDLGYMF